MAKKTKTTEKSLDVLKEELKTKKDELFKAKMEHARRKLVNTTSLTNMRKEIAKILTTMKQMQKEVKNG